MKVLHKHLLIAFAFASLLLMFSCDRNEAEDIVGKGEELTLQVQMDGQFSVAQTRAQGTDPSLNQDAAEREDWVEKVAMLIFETGDTGNKVAEAYVTAPTISTKIKEGTYDFFFIANYPGDSTSLNGLTKAELLAYLQTLRPFTDYQGVAGNSAVAFPMARLYLNQNITKGADPLNTPFTPNVGTDKQLSPVSSFGKDWETTATQSKVRFVRACAKVMLNFMGEGRGDITSVQYINAAANYSFAELNPLPTTAPAVATAQQFTLVPDDVALITKSQLYVPERLFGETEGGWDNTTDAAKGGVNYIQITMNSGKVYKIPIISNQLLASTESYLDVARGNSTTAPDYNVIRNHHYRILCKLDKTIEVYYSIGDWNLEDKSLFMGMGYQVELLNGKLTVTNTMPACDPHKITLKPVNGATLNGGTAPLLFVSLNEGATTSYTINNGATPAGSAYLEIYYNDKLVKSYIK